MMLHNLYLEESMALIKVNLILLFCLTSGHSDHLFHSNFSLPVLLFSRFSNYFFLFSGTVDF